MGWICKVCGAPAIEVIHFGTSKADAKGRFKVMGLAYCEQHKHAVKKVGEKQ